MTDTISELAETLERQKSRANALEKELKESKAQIKSLEEFRAVMEDVQGINAMSRRKLKSTEVDDIPQMTDSIPELILRIRNLENIHTHWRNTKNDLNSTVNTLEEQAHVKKTTLQDMQRQVLALKGYTCWNMRKMHKENSFEADNHARELLKELAALKAENDTLEGCNIEQTKLIGELSAHIEANLCLPEDFANTCDILDGKKQELIEVREANEREQRLLAQKDRIISQKKAIRDPARQYDSKKRVLQSDLRKATEMRRMEEKAVLARQNKINSTVEKARAMIKVVQKKIAASSAHGQKKIHPKKSSPSEFFSKQTDLLKLIEETHAHDAQLIDVEKKIEKAESDIVVIERSKSSAAKRHEIASKVRLEEILDLESDLSSREKAYQRQKKLLQRDNEVLEQEVQRKLRLAS